MSDAREGDGVKTRRKPPVIHLPCPDCSYGVVETDGETVRTPCWFCGDRGPTRKEAAGG